MKCADCTMFLYCLARINDSSIGGCTLPEYLIGDAEEILIEHVIRLEKRE